MSETDARLIPCTKPDCARSFISDTAMFEHAQAVHTFDDTRRLVQNSLRDQWGRVGNYTASPVVDSIYAWISEIAADWVVFERESGDMGQLWKVSYAVADDVVTFGKPVQVVRRTVFDAVKGAAPIAGGPNDAESSAFVPFAKKDAAPDKKVAMKTKTEAEMKAEVVALKKAGQFKKAADMQKMIDKMGTAK